MALGRKTGGRQVGTPNKRTVMLKGILERLDAAGHDPVNDILERLDRISDLERIKVNLSLLDYIYAKKRQVETTLDPSVAEHLKEVEGKSDEELAEILRPVLTPVIETK